MESYERWRTRAAKATEPTVVAISMKENHSGVGVGVGGGGGGYRGNSATEYRAAMVDIGGDEPTESREEGELCSDSDVLLHLSCFGI